MTTILAVQDQFVLCPLIFSIPNKVAKLGSAELGLKEMASSDEMLGLMAIRFLL